MKTDTTTPASVASRLTDEEILDLAELQNELGNSSSSYVLRDYVLIRNENAQLKARLEAVLKECEKMRDDFSKRMHSFTGIGASNMRNIYKDKIEVVDGILRLARGEGGAE